MTLVPALFFGGLEGGLRAFGYGYSTRFFLPIEGRETYTTNQRFAWRFFPRAITRTPVVCELSPTKDAATYRIFVLGGSAALGTPDEAYGFGRVLEVMLEETYPGVKFEVVNAAMTAINSHVVLPIARDCAEMQPDLFVVYMGNNEVVGPYGAGTVFRGYSPSLATIRAGVWVRSTRAGQLLEDLSKRLAEPEAAPGQWQGMGMFLDHRVAADDPRLEQVYAHLRDNLSDIVDVGLASGARVVVSTVATNLVDNAPFASLRRDGQTEAEASRWDGLVEAGAALAEAGKHEAAVAKLVEALAVDDGAADLHYRLARSYVSLGRLEDARIHFLRARDLDALRFRADTRINGVIREVAEGRRQEGVYLVDAADALEAAAAESDGLPGRELFYDHVHLNFDGNYLLAETFLEAVEAALPPRLRDRRPGAGGPPSPERCAELLALTGWDRGRLLEEMSRIMDVAPFTHQLDYEEQRAYRRQQIALLEQQHLSVEALEEARAVYGRALERDPKDLAISANLVTLLEKLGEDEAAAGLLRALLQRVPSRAAWHGWLGDVLHAQGLQAEAVAEYREAMRLLPGRASPHIRAGRALARMGRPREAAAELRRALEINPGSVEASLALGSVLDEEGHSAEAIEAHRATLALDPGNREALVRLGRALQEQGDFGGAAQRYRELLEIEPELAAAHYGLALALVKQGHAAEGVSHFREAVRLAPDWPLALNGLAWVLATHARAPLRSGDEAALLAERASRLSGEPVPLFLDTLAAAYAEVGRFEDAVRIARRAREVAVVRGETDLTSAIEARLELYESGRPFRATR